MAETVEYTQAQYEEQYADALRLLEKSALEYDKGDYAEAGRMAALIVKLIDDRPSKRGNFISLSTRLNLKPIDVLTLALNFEGVNPIEHEYWTGPMITVGFLPAYSKGILPILDGFEEFPKWALYTPREFNDWWNAPIIRDISGNIFSRKIIIQTMRDKEAVHTDEEVGRPYADLAYSDSANLKLHNDAGITFDANPTRVAVRHVAHELLKTLLPAYGIHFSIPAGGRVMPMIVAETMRIFPNGIQQLVRKEEKEAIAFGLQMTNSNNVWEQWHANELDSIKTRAKAATENIPKSTDGSTLYFRIGLANWSPYGDGVVRVSIPPP